jgi:hypothetical protein
MPTLNQAQPPSASKDNNSGIEMNFIMAFNLQFDCDAGDVALK